MVINNQSRNTKGAVPIHVPLLIFFYALVFLTLVEFVMLFWLQSSINTAAKQIAIAAATNNQFPLTADGVRQRCLAAANKTNAVGPGYHRAVREDFVAGLSAGLKNYNVIPYSEQMRQQGDNNFGATGSSTTAAQDPLRAQLVTMGAARPNSFWDGYSATNAQNGGCFALMNPITRQVTFHVVINSRCVWPIFLKGFFDLSHRATGGQNNYGGMTGMNSHIRGTTGQAAKETINHQGYCGWLEGRGSYAVTGGGSIDLLGANRSLLSSSTRPCILCTTKDCDFAENNKYNVDQTTIASGVNQDGTVSSPVGIAKPFGEVANSNLNRPRPNTMIIGTSKMVYSIDQWATNRSLFCQRCQPAPCPLIPSKDRDNEYCEGQKPPEPAPIGIRSIANCGDLDPLVINGLRYSCMGVLYPDGKAIPLEILGRCDHYFKVVPCGFPDKDKGVALPNIAGDVTNLDGRGGPVVVRRKGQACTDTKVVCRTDSAPVQPWIGPFGTVGAQLNPNLQDGQRNADAMHQVIKQAYDQSDTSAPGKHPTSPLANPLDQLIPYHQVCDICNPGSPMCGYFGTCKDQEDNWKQAVVVLRGEWWSNTAFYELNPMYFNVECKYRRDCQLNHCCWGVYRRQRPVLEQYCANRPINGQKIIELGCGWGRVNRWEYYGVPNAEAETYSDRHLPRDGDFPMCSSAAYKKYNGKVGECCAAEVRLLRYECPGLMPPIQDLSNAKPCLSNCASKTSCDIRCNKRDKYGKCFMPNPQCFTIAGKCIIPRPICIYGKCTPPPPPPKPPAQCNYPCSKDRSCTGGLTCYNPNNAPQGYCRNPNCLEQANCLCLTTQIIIELNKVYQEIIQISDQAFFVIINGAGEDGYYCAYGCVKPKPSSSSSSGQPSSSSSSSGNSCKKRCDTYYSPLFISLDASPIKSAHKQAGFKLNPKDADSVKYSWIKAQGQQGFVAYDFNKNGVVDDGSEVFGNFTNGKFYRDAYQALRENFDKDHDSVISKDELKGLLLWQDKDENGICQASELSSLLDLGVIELNAGKSLDSVKTVIGEGIYAMPHSNLGVKVSIDGNVVNGKSWDVWLKRSNEVASSTNTSVNLWSELKNKLSEWTKSTFTERKV